MTDTLEPPNDDALTVTTCAAGLVLVGELDMATVPLLRASVHDAADSQDRRIAIDMSEVAFMDSSGLRELISLHRSGAAFTLRNPSRPVTQILELTQSSGVFEIEVDP